MKMKIMNKQEYYYKYTDDYYYTNAYIQEAYPFVIQKFHQNECVIVIAYLIGGRL